MYYDATEAMINAGLVAGKRKASLDDDVFDGIVRSCAARRDDGADPGDGAANKLVEGGLSAVSAARSRGVNGAVGRMVDEGLSAVSSSLPPHWATNKLVEEGRSAVSSSATPHVAIQTLVDEGLSAVSSSLPPHGAINKLVEEGLSAVSSSATPHGAIQALVDDGLSAVSSSLRPHGATNTLVEDGRRAVSSARQTGAFKDAALDGLLHGASYVARRGSIEQPAATNRAAADELAGATVMRAQFESMQPPPIIPHRPSSEQPSTRHLHAAASGAAVMSSVVHAGAMRWEISAERLSASAVSSVRLSKLYHEIGALAASSPNAHEGLGDVVCAEARARAAEDNLARLAAQNVLLRIERDAAKVTASELDGQLREQQMRWADELSTAVEEHNATGVFSSLIAAEASGLISSDLIKIINGAASRLNAKRGGAASNESEQAFYISLYVSSREAARLVSEAFGGPSVECIHGWVKKYPHIRPGPQYSSVRHNMGHALDVWRRAGKDVSDGSVEVRSRSSTADSPTQPGSQTVDCAPHRCTRATMLQLCSREYMPI